MAVEAAEVDDFYDPDADVDDDDDGDDDFSGFDDLFLLLLFLCSDLRVRRFCP